MTETLSDDPSASATDLRRLPPAERARALAAGLRDRAAEAEELRRMPDATIEDFVDSGLAQVMAPTHHGGEGQDLRALTDAVVEVGRVCGSSAWILAIYGIHNWMAGLFPDRVQDEMFAEGDHVLFPGSFAPTGEATKVDGGYRVSGRWQWASGVYHASWIAVATVVSGSDPELPDVRCFLLPRDDVNVIDTWHFSGLKGTGSMDVELRDAFVPEHRAVPFIEIVNGESEGWRNHGAAIHRIPMFSALAAVATAPAVGMALGALDVFRERTLERMQNYTGKKQVAQVPTQVRYAAAAAETEAARLLLQSTVDRLGEVTSAGEVPSLDQRVQLRRDCAYAVSLCKSAIGTLVDGSGAGGQHESSPMQRFGRDIQALRTHVVYDTDAAYELYGRVAFDLPPDSLMF